MGPRPWRLVETEAVEDCKVFQVQRVHARSPYTGRVHPFYRLESSDWVNVVPLTAEGELVMVRQFRHGSGAVTLEIPGGIVDPGETPEDAARRELLEETGYSGGRLEPLGSLNPNPALFANRVHSFVVRDVERVADVANTEFEETVVRLVPWREVPALVQAGEVDHALVIAAFHWLAIEGERGAPRG